LVELLTFLVGAAYKSPDHQSIEKFMQIVGFKPQKIAIEAITKLGN